LLIGLEKSGDVSTRTGRLPATLTKKPDGAGTEQRWCWALPFQGAREKFFRPAAGGARGKIKVKIKVKVKVNCTSSLRAWRAGLVGVGLRDTP
jgi:hypothetical protein